MNISPIVDSYGYLMYSIKNDKRKNVTKDFQQFLIEEIYAPALVPDSIENEDENEDENEIFSSNSLENKLYNQIIRRNVAEQLVENDALNLNSVLEQAIQYN